MRSKFSMERCSRGRRSSRSPASPVARRFTSQRVQSSAYVKSLAPYVDRTHRTVTSSNGQLRLDYEHGILQINSPRAQGVSGNLAGW